MKAARKIFHTAGAVLLAAHCPVRSRSVKSAYGVAKAIGYADSGLFVRSLGVGTYEEDGGRVGHEFRALRVLRSCYGSTR
jgi:hypothetical protein